MDSGLVRDLRNGEWSELLSHPDCHLSPRAKQFLMMLKKERRLLTYPAILDESIVTGADWCREALASNKCSRLTGIMTTEQVAEHFKSESLVALINKIVAGKVEWWQPLKGNIEVKRDIRSYLLHLKPILRYANSLLFVDPYLDPSTRKGYAKFPQIIAELTKRERLPSMVQIHRQGEYDKDNNRRLTISEWEARFNDVLLPIISRTKLKIDVFIWNDCFHDRYLLSDLAGIQMSNGFDEKNPKQSIEITTWSRLDKKLTEDRYRMYDPAYRPNNHLLGRFEVGHN